MTATRAHELRGDGVALHHAFPAEPLLEPLAELAIPVLFGRAQVRYGLVPRTAPEPRFLGEDGGEASGGAAMGIKGSNAKAQYGGGDKSVNIEITDVGGLAGLMVGLYYGQINFTMGWVYGLKAFTAAILGGIGNIPGAMVGGLLLGVIEALGAAYLSIAWKDAIAFCVLILILIVRPTGLLGERVAEKV